MLAHQLALITVQANAGLALLKNHQPGRASESLMAIKEAGNSALGELRWVLNALRMPDGVPARRPAPMLSRAADLTQLTDAARAAGLAVDVRSTGPPPPPRSLTRNRQVSGPPRRPAGHCPAAFYFPRAPPRTARGHFSRRKFFRRCGGNPAPARRASRPAAWNSHREPTVPLVQRPPRSGQWLGLLPLVKCIGHEYG